MMKCLTAGGEHRAHDGGSWKFALFAIFGQLMFLALYAFAFEWSDDLLSPLPLELHEKYRMSKIAEQLILSNLFSNSSTKTSIAGPDLKRLDDLIYLCVFQVPKIASAMWQHIHVMVYVGFGFLLVFPSKNVWNSVGFTFALGVFCYQWATLTNSFFDWIYFKRMIGYLTFDMDTIINGDFCIASVMIAYSACIGKLSPFQLLFMGFVQTFLWSLNGYFCLDLLQAHDVGGAMTIHTFGAYFGLCCMLAYFIGVKKGPIGHPGWNSSYNSDSFAMIGCLFLWLYWPSYNAALATGGGNLRAVIITLLGLCSSSVVAIAFSYGIRGKVSMFDVQNASLAGGVATGACADLAIQPWAGIVLGIAAGTVSILGYIYLLPFLEKTIKLHDSAGIHNLHALPGVIGGLATVFSSLAAQSEFWGGYHIGFIQAARAPANATIAAAYGLAPGLGRTANEQAGFQMIALAVSIFTGVAGGLGTGIVLRLPIFDGPKYDHMFNDDVYWIQHYPDEHLHEDEQLSTISGGSVKKETD